MSERGKTQASGVLGGRSDQKSLEGNSGETRLQGNGTQERPPGWREEWRAPRKRKQDPTVSRARAGAGKPLPSPRELREEALQVLRDIAADDTALPTARVGAAKVLAEIGAPPIAETITKLLDGDPEKYETWLRAELARIEAKKQNAT